MRRARIMIIDGQGGKLGCQLIEEIRRRIPDAIIHAVGTNSTAAANMIRGGADSGATGENAVIVGSRNADIISGPMGIVISDALFGEITPKMARAVGSSRAVRVLIPMNKCDTLIVGMGNFSIGELIAQAADTVKSAADELLNPEY